MTGPSRPGDPPEPFPAPTGRYSGRVARAICERLAAGEPLTAICADPAMPGYSTVMRWLAARTPFRAMYGEARALQAHALADRVLETAERGDLPPADKQARIKALTWMAGKLAPIKYGDRPAPGAEGDGGPLFTVVLPEGEESSEC